MDLVTLATFLRNQVTLSDRPPVGCVQMNNEEAMTCVQALESELKRRDSRAQASQEMRDLIDFAENQWLDWSEDVAMGGGTGAGAEQRKNVDQKLHLACVMADRWKAITTLIKEAAERQAA